MIKSVRISVLAVLLFISLPGIAQFTITENFRGSSSSGVTLGGAASLTSGSIDPEGQGWLRLTPATQYQLGYGIVNNPFPSTLGVLVDFEYTAWRNAGSGADGFSVFLFNPTVLPFSIGGVGGSLGYAQYTDDPTDPGLTGGYLGIGIDAFGNFSSNVNGKSGGPGNTPNAVVVRGPAPNYGYITSTQIIASDAGTGDNGGVDYNTLTSTRPTEAQFYRRIQFEVLPSGINYVLNVRWKTSPNGNFVNLLGPIVLSTPPPPQLKVGFAASTGLEVNNHEIRNVLITTPGNTRVRKFGPTHINFPGTPTIVPYDIVVSNGTPATVTGITLSDQLPAGYTATLADLSVNNYGNPVNQVNNLAISPSGELTADINLAPMEEVTIRVNGKLNSIPPTSMLLNLVTVGPGNITDVDLTNNTALAQSTVLDILPVTLKSFDARKTGETVTLDWITTEETQFAYTAIERSADGTSFKELGRVSVQAGNTPEKKYRYVDGAPLSGKSFYRLKLVDLDGRFTYSGIRQIAINDKHSWNVYPNPASDKALVELPASWRQGATQWSILDITGRKIKSGVSYSGNVLQIPVSNVPQGRYTLLLQHQQGARQSLPLQINR